MDRLRPFIGSTIDPARLADAAAIEALGFRGRWIPDPLEDFDEIEVVSTLDVGRDLIVTVAVEEARIARILLGWGPMGDDDADRRGFSEEELAGALAAHGDRVRDLLAAWTGG